MDEILWRGVLLFAFTTTSIMRCFAKFSVPKEQAETGRRDMGSSKSLGIHMRLLGKPDIDRIMEIEHESFTDPWQPEDFKEMAKSNSHLCNVAVVNGKIVGYMIYEIRKSTFYIKSMAVARSMRRQGIGAKMIAHMHELLEETNRTSVRLHVAENNLAAQLFFRAIGFRAVNVCRNFFGELDAYYMIRRTKARITCAECS